LSELLMKADFYDLIDLQSIVQIASGIASIIQTNFYPRL